MSRLRKTVVPFRWNAIAIAFTSGTAGSANLAAFLANPEGRTITYSVVGTLPTGVTLSGSTVSYNGAGAVASASVQFRAVSDTFTALSSSTAVTISEAPVNNPAPTWAANTPSSLGSFTGAGTFDLGPYGVDTEPLTFARTGSVTDTAPGSVTVSSSGLVTIPALTAGNYTVVASVSDGTNPPVSRTFTFTAVAATAGFTAEPGFSVTSSTGAFEDGATITITGSGFGTMGGDAVMFATGDEGADGEKLDGTTPTVGSAISTNVIGVGADTTGRHLRFSSTVARSGRSRSLARFRVGTDGSQRNGGFGPSTQNKKIYFQYWRYETYDSVTAASSNYKHFYVFGNGTAGDGTTEKPQPIFISAQSDTRMRMANNIANAVQYPSPANLWSDTYNRNRWVLYEHYHVLSDYGSANGIVSVSRDGNNALLNTAFNWQPGTMNVPSTLFKNLRLGYYDAGFTNMVVYHSDVYVATTQARVVVADSANWSTATAKEIQVARNANWSDGSIQASMNKGAFTSLAGKYLFVVKSDGSAVRIGSFN